MQEDSAAAPSLLLLLTVAPCLCCCFVLVAAFLCRLCESHAEDILAGDLCRSAALGAAPAAPTYLHAADSAPQGVQPTTVRAHTRQGWRKAPPPPPSSPQAAAAGARA